MKEQNLHLLKRSLVLFIREELGKFGFKRAVLGLSGGVDSSLVAFLTVEALGKENVIAAILPYRLSSPESVAHARLVADTLGLSPLEINITPLADPFIQTLGIEDRNRIGNVLARVRMIVLYDLSAKYGALVVGTSNKTELLLGYGTLWGDLAHAINPLGDLYKTQVWELAEYVGVPEVIVKKKPTADLWPGQTDEGELGLSYREADAILYEILELHRRPQQLYGRYGKAKVDRVFELLRRNQFKRKPPIIAKVGQVTINHEFIAPRDWGV